MVATVHAWPPCMLLRDRSRRYTVPQPCVHADPVSCPLGGQASRHPLHEIAPCVRIGCRGGTARAVRAPGHAHQLTCPLVAVHLVCLHVGISAWWRVGWLMFNMQEQACFCRRAAHPAMPSGLQWKHGLQWKQGAAVHGWAGAAVCASAHVQSTLLRSPRGGGVGSPG